jgi:NAD(P)-dependent dehydrogenase (short-subunit alcohol dehydrogenase family)
MKLAGKVFVLTGAGGGVGVELALALINNAGIIQPFRKVNELSVDEAARVMGVNFTGSLQFA